MTDRTRVLIVDDDDDIRALLRDLLSRAGYEVDEASDGRAALRQLLDVPPELVILDVTMPGIDGYATLERIRDLSDVPVLMLTARKQELERVRGLTTGADDYVAKPFGRQELLARVQALLRRAGGTTVSETYADDFVTIDYGRRQVTAEGRDIQLTPLEFKLLSAFAQNPNRILTQDQLVELVWGDSHGVASDQVVQYVESLRTKLVPGAPERAPLETVPGPGYRYRSESSSRPYERPGCVGGSSAQEILMCCPDSTRPT
jgi:DNA-binding response OmpR family regulator